MNYLSLRYFLEVASHLNFSQAAKKLRISQPALSQQISALEKIVGFKLFNRNTRQISLTVEGEYMLNKIKPSFQNIDMTINRMIEHKSIPLEKIKIATIPTAASKYMPYLFKKVLTLTPNIELFLLETSSPQGEKLIKSHKYDISFIRTPINKTRLIKNNLGLLELKKHPLKFIVSSRHPLASQTEIDLNQAENEYFIHYDPNNAPSLNYLFNNVCSSADLFPKKLCTVSELFTIFNLVANNLGVAIIPNDIVQLINSDKIKALDIEQASKLYSSISIIWNKENYSSLNVVEHLVSIMEQSKI